MPRSLAAPRRVSESGLDNLTWLLSKSMSGLRSRRVRRSTSSRISSSLGSRLVSLFSIKKFTATFLAERSPAARSAKACSTLVDLPPASGFSAPLAKPIHRRETLHKLSMKSTNRIGLRMFDGVYPENIEDLSFMPSPLKHDLAESRKSLFTTGTYHQDPFMQKAPLLMMPNGRHGLRRSRR